MTMLNNQSTEQYLDVQLVSYTSTESFRATDGKTGAPQIVSSEAKGSICILKTETS